MSQMPSSAAHSIGGAPLEAVAAPLVAAAEQTRNLMEASVRTWTDESQAFIDDMFRDGGAALQALQACQSPLDVITVEQQWLMARSQAYLNAGMRMMLGAFAQAEEAAAQAGALHLPE